MLIGLGYQQGSRGITRNLGLCLFLPLLVVFFFFFFCMWTSATQQIEACIKAWDCARASCWASAVLAISNKHEIIIVVGADGNLKWQVLQGKFWWGCLRKYFSYYSKTSYTTAGSVLIFFFLNKRIHFFFGLTMQCLFTFRLLNLLLYLLVKIHIGLKLANSALLRAGD